MKPEQNIALAELLLAGFREGIDHGDLAKLFSPSVSLEVQGDDDVIPWIGRKTGRGAAAAFFRKMRESTEIVRCNVDEILGSESRAIIVGDFALRFVASGRVFKTQFAMVLTIAHGEITRFQVLSDSFRLSQIVLD